MSPDFKVGKDNKWFRQCVGIDIAKEKFNVCLFMYRVTEGSICGKYKNLQVEHCLEISYQSYCCILNDKIDKDVYFRLFSKNKSIHSFISMMNLLHKQIKIYIP